MKRSPTALCRVYVSRTHAHTPGRRPHAVDRPWSLRGNWQPQQCLGWSAPASCRHWRCHASSDAARPASTRGGVTLARTLQDRGVYSFHGATVRGDVITRHADVLPGDVQCCRDASCGAAFTEQVHDPIDGHPWACHFRPTATIDKHHWFIPEWKGGTSDDGTRAGA